MLGLMQDWPLLVSRLIDHAAREHGDRLVVTAAVEGGIRRRPWREIDRRARALAQALTRLGVATGDRVASCAWNSDRHLESWFAVAGMGAVMHTLNPRLFPDQLRYIVTHAQDRVILFDACFLKLVEALYPALGPDRHYVVMTDPDHMPESAVIPNLLCYETLVEAEKDTFTWPELDERLACGLCYTSGTTGPPKGVLYSHRSTVLHTLAASMADALGVSVRDVLLPIVPMFHANAWGIPYMAAALGAKLVLNGPHFDPVTLQRLIREEGVTFTAAVPTVWLAMLEYLDRGGGDLIPLKAVLIGGAAAPRAMIAAFQERYGIQVSHAWGMTEMSPLGTVGTLTPEVAQLEASAQLDRQTSQGRPVFGVALKIVDAQGAPLPRDGVTPGHVRVRGPWVARAYFHSSEEESPLDAEGYFDTGDIAVIDPEGYVHLTDRAKDVIKSGGEWISSLALENIAQSHEAVAEAAVIGIAHPKWDERPLLIVVPKTGFVLEKEAILTHMAAHLAKWQRPDEVVFVEDLPHTATGKLDKRALRTRFAAFSWQA